MAPRQGPDGKVLYTVDSERFAVYRRSWDPETGVAGTRESFITVTGGFPDGMTIDAEGCLWIAVWGASEVRRYSASGHVLAVVEVPAAKPSSVAFAGDDLSTLVITTASRDLSQEELGATPLAGHLFTTKPRVAGTPQPFWSGTLSTRRA